MAGLREAVLFSFRYPTMRLLEVQGDRLVVTGEKRAQREESGKSYYFSERVYGQFRRSFRVPEDADLDTVSAAHKDGVPEMMATDFMRNLRRVRGPASRVRLLIRGWRESDPERRMPPNL